MSYIIRQAQLADARELLDIYAPYVLTTPVSFETEVPSLSDFILRIQKIMEIYPYLVAVEDGKILGYAYAAPHMARAAYGWNAELSVYVAPNQKLRGIAKSLCGSLIAIMERQGFKNIYACITFPNDESISFHEKLGFEKVGHFSKCGFKQGHWHDIIWMVKRIGDFQCLPAVITPITEMNKEKIMSALLKNI